ncbi:hypothetical protein SGL43_05131 [Streptomyces globisporus]|uniref:Uncharacterized protein n=2 Tax=Streptomyces TaxID=1883 RepID=A0ABM9H3A1_STRGL|nr:predicted protein [Streptomyces filamentosus NRRL 15998]CAH9418083.1 hypothetical protein SGL43_05131 [Streptomyces globisporus]
MCEAQHASGAFRGELGTSTPAPRENFGGAPVHPGGPNGVL